MRKIALSIMAITLLTLGVIAPKTASANARWDVYENVHTACGECIDHVTYEMDMFFQIHEISRVHGGCTYTGPCTTQ